MTHPRVNGTRHLWKTAPYLMVVLAVGIGLLADTPVARQPRSRGCFFGRMQSVGGVAIAPDGAVKQAGEADIEQLQRAREQTLDDVPADLARPSPLRKISLRQLEAAIAAVRERAQPLDDSMRVLAGLQDVRYVCAVPEERDIILAGFAEGWTVDRHGAIVGRSTGKPVLWLEDLVVAMRSLRQAGPGVITCSIDPTAEGLERLRKFVPQLKTIGDPSSTAHAVEQVLGPQTISVGGVPKTSHFARVLVAADYRMKRLGMGFEPAPVPGLPSYLQMMTVGRRGMQNMTPRWWMVPDYGTPLRDAQGSAWELPVTAVKTLTEDTFFADDGTRQSQTGQRSTAAQAWADKMTARYEALAEKEPIFGQLRGCMKLALVASLVVHANLAEKAGHDFRVLLADSELLPPSEYLEPRKIDTQASLVRRGRSWVIGASGGVQIAADQGWRNAREGSLPAASELRRSASRPNDAWWWD